jgi:hypothetical protein
MSTQFVRYTPDIEAADPYFDENLQIVIGKIEEYIAGSATTEGTGRAVRDAHAKGYGVVKAEVEILGQVPAEYAQGIYAVPGKHGALIRFSNGQPHAGPDMLLGPVVGLALKIFDITGPALLADEPDTGTFDSPLSTRPSSSATPSGTICSSMTCSSRPDSTSLRGAKASIASSVTG